MEEEIDAIPTKKRSISEDVGNRPGSNKKVRLGFSGKKLRNQLKSDKRVEALQEFLRLINEESREECIAAYLEHGGSTLEILQLMESDSTLSPILIFEITTQILLQINSKLPQYRNTATEACRYLLNTYITLINKMLGLASSSKERLTILKLLTAIVTFSVLLAKDILLHVNFNPTNLELLTKVTGKNDVRSAFIHFIIAFLVDYHYPTLSVLLDKKGFMTSIVKGLQYDNADLVVLILTVMRDHILENPSVSKTAKMKTFNTQVVKNIVNLYNWKGPGGVVDEKKTTKVIPVDEVEKSKVNEAVHAFLLVLCTSKFGVIFRDYSMGLGKKHNMLLYTVLESLERPWEHSYAGELVRKICQACPDLTKTIWNNMKTTLEPRWTAKWLNSMKFAAQLVEELEPECIEFCVYNLNVHQMVQVITTLVVPLSVLKTIIPEDHSYDKPAIKYQVLFLLLKMTKSLQNYLEAAKKWHKVDREVLRLSLETYLSKNFPEMGFILKDWDKSDDELTMSDYLETALDLLEQYKILAPKMLQEYETVDIEELLAKIESERKLQVKAVKLFMDLEPTRFRPKSDLFRTVVSFSLEFYHESKDINALFLLRSILRNSAIFDGVFLEIDFWIDGVLNLKHFDKCIANFLCDLMKKTDENLAQYNRHLLTVKNSKFSPLTLALGDYFDKTEPSKALKNYLYFVFLNLFHVQIDSTAFSDVVLKLQILPKDLVTYIQKWNSHEVVALKKCKGNLCEHFRKFSMDFLEGCLEFSNLDVYPNLKLNLLQASIFYLNNLQKTNSLGDNHKQNCRKFVDFLLSKDAFQDGRLIEVILGNPTILQNFTLFDPNDVTTKLVLSVVKNVKTSVVEDYSIDFRRKIGSVISKIFKKPQKYSETTICLEVLEIFGLDYEQCTKLVEKFVDLEDNRCFYRVAGYCLNRMSSLVKDDLKLPPLSNEVITGLSHHLTMLIKDEISNSHEFSVAFLNYLRIFPHNLEGVEIELLDGLLTLSEYHKDNLTLCEFLLERKSEFLVCFQKNIDEICSKKGFLLTLLHVVTEQSDDAFLETIFNKFEGHIMRALQKPHKAGQHFQNHYKSVGILVEKFLKSGSFGAQIQKFETTELFHVHLLKIVYDKTEKDATILGNMIMTFIHLLVNLLKQKSAINLVEICDIFENFLQESTTDDFDLTFLAKNETFKTFCKLCLKFGLSGNAILLKILNKLVQLCLKEDDAKLILDMLLSHSQFLDVVLGESDKTDLMNLWRILCEKWPQFMERSHVPVLLSSYRATRSECDKIVLKLLKMYEAKPDQTHFVDFKPFLWGRAAASYYSVSSDVQKVLWRQPKMGDVLENLHRPTILATITDPWGQDSYDLEYFLPLFSHLLAPENPVHTYRFTKSGALALTITGFRGDKTQKLATCHVLSRFYFHQEARQSGKDNLLWLRFVEAICKGTAALDDLKMNNFVGVFLARMALVLTQPTDVMYVPLTQYLAAKDALDFNTIPELYTFLHSPQVEFKEHKNFILEVLRDGLKCEKDLTTLLRSMGFKLISELCSSTVCDFETKILILDIFKNCCRFPLGIKVLCGSLSFLPQVFGLYVTICKKKEKEAEAIVSMLLQILLEIVQIDDNRQRNFLIYLNLMMMSEDEQCFSYLKDSKDLDVYYLILLKVVERFPTFLSVQNMNEIVQKSSDQFCIYLIKKGCRFVRKSDFSNDPSLKYLRLLIYNKLKFMNKT